LIFGLQRLGTINPLRDSSVGFGRCGETDCLQTPELNTLSGEKIASLLHQLHRHLLVVRTAFHGGTQIRLGRQLGSYRLERGGHLSPLLVALLEAS
uniref:Reverse transcriptase domain-containing protein n=1 Tax=Taenia asiatica TaxID=60517 RepID=A0A0R3W1K7_TAEAS